MFDLCWDNSLNLAFSALSDPTHSVMCWHAGTMGVPSLSSEGILDIVSQYNDA